MTELPIVIVDVQRGGPSTGLPTKTEQSDLFQALYGRNGECPVVVIATSTPSATSIPGLISSMAIYLVLSSVSAAKTEAQINIGNPITAILYMESLLYFNILFPFTTTLRGSSQRSLMKLSF
jgi:hypothetical protein